MPACLVVLVRADISPSPLRYIYTQKIDRERENTVKTHTRVFYIEVTIRLLFNLSLSLSSLGACRYSIWQMLKLYSVLSRRMFGIVVHCCCVYICSCGSRFFFSLHSFIRLYCFRSFRLLLLRFVSFCYFFLVYCRSFFCERNNRKTNFHNIFIGRFLQWSFYGSICICK